MKRRNVLDVEMWREQNKRNGREQKYNSAQIKSGKYENEKYGNVRTTNVTWSRNTIFIESRNMKIMNMEI